MESYARKIAAATREELIAQGKADLMEGQFDSSGIFQDKQVRDFARKNYTKNWKLVKPSSEAKDNLKIVLKKFR